MGELGNQNKRGRGFQEVLEGDPGSEGVLWMKFREGGILR